MTFRHYVHCLWEHRIPCSCNLTMIALGYNNFLCLNIGLYLNFKNITQSSWTFTVMKLLYSTTIDISSSVLSSGCDTRMCRQQFVSFIGFHFNSAPERSLLRWIECGWLWTVLNNVVSYSEHKCMYLCSGYYF